MNFISWCLDPVPDPTFRNSRIRVFLFWIPPQHPVPAVLLQIYINFVLQLILPFIPVDALRIVARVLDLGEVELPLETDGQAAQVAGHPAFT